MFYNFRMPVARTFVPTPWRSLLAALSVFVLLLMGTPSVHAQPSQQNQMAKILADWKAREAEIHTLRMTWTQEKLIPRGSLPKMGPEVVNRPPDDAVVPPEDVRLLTTHVFELDGEKVRYSLDGETWDMPSNQRTSWRDTRVWDGQTNSLLGDLSAASHPFGVIDGGRMDPMLTNNPEILSIRLFARPVMPAFDGMIKTPSLRWTHRTGTVGDRPCVILEQMPPSRRPGRAPQFYSEVWVDLERGSLPCRWLSIEGGGIRADLKMDYTAQENGHWQLSGWTLQHVGRTPGSLTKSVTVSVDDFVLNPEIPSSTFTMNYPARTMVGDKRHSPRPQFHVVRTDGTRRDLQPGESSEDYPQLIQPPARWQSFAIWTLALVVVIAGVTFILRNRLRSQ